MENDTYTSSYSPLPDSTDLPVVPKTDELTGEIVSVYRAYVSPLVVVVGVLGNILVIIVFLSETRKTRFTVYAVFLALTDTTALVVNSFMDDFLGRGLLYLTNNPIKFDTMSTPMCKFMEFLPNVAYFGSSYILICFSFDRVLTIFNPVKYYSEHYIRSAIIICAVTLSLSICINMPMLIGNQLVHNSSHGIDNVKCETPGRDYVSKFALYLKVIVVFSLATLLVLIINSIIIGKLFCIYRARRKLLSNPKENRMEMGRVVGHFVLSTIFFFLNLPLVIVMLIRLQGNSHPTVIHLSRLFSSIKDINYAVNFFLYFIFLAMFRWRFLAILCGSCIRFSWFKKVPGHVVLQDGIERYERHQQPQRKRSAIAALAQQVTNNFGVGKGSTDKKSSSDHSSNQNRTGSFELTTEIINSESYNTHL